MDEKAFAFIICVNNEEKLEECKLYLSYLKIPEGYRYDIVTIYEADSMTGAYNAAMKSSDAKYKVYMHQDVYIKNRSFMEDVLEVFEKDEKIGMLGLTGGVELPANAVAYLAWNRGMLDVIEPDVSYVVDYGQTVGKTQEVEAVDGFLMVTQYDIPWREDLFEEFDFYDISQSFEMRRKGWKVCIPYQKEPWAIHDSGYAKLINYDKNRRICMQEYPEYLTGAVKNEFVYEEDAENKLDILEEQECRLFDAGRFSELKKLLEEYLGMKHRRNQSEYMRTILEIIEMEESHGISVCKFITEGMSWECALERYLYVKQMLRRIDNGLEEKEYTDFIEMVLQHKISLYALLTITCHTCIRKKEMVQLLQELYRAN